MRETREEVVRTADQGSQRKLCPNLLCTCYSVFASGPEVIAATAHIRTMLTDPGAVPRYASPLPDPSEIMETGGVEEDQGEDKETSRLTSGAEMDEGAAAGGGVSGAGNGLGAGGQLDAPNNSETNEVSRSTPQTPIKWCHK